MNLDGDDTLARRRFLHGLIIDFKLDSRVVKLHGTKSKVSVMQKWASEKDDTRNVAVSSCAQNSKQSVYKRASYQRDFRMTCLISRCILMSPWYISLRQSRQRIVLLIASQLLYIIYKTKIMKNYANLIICLSSQKSFPNLKICKFAKITFVLWTFYKINYNSRFATFLHTFL